MTQEIINLCKRAAQLNYSAKYRRGSIAHLPDTGKVVITGDLHGHRRNFEKITGFADLSKNLQTHLVLQEILHGGPEDNLGGCLSFNLLFDVLRYRLRFPDRVHIILGNHDTAVINDNNVLKSGKEMTQAMKAAMKRRFGDGYEPVEVALKQYLLSQLLAVKCPNRIWISHSLPADGYVHSFDTKIFDRKLSLDDVIRPGPAYLFTWGRAHSDQALAELAQIFDVDIFIVGHQPQDTGWTRAGKNLIILASDHNHGCLIWTDLAQSYTIEQLADSIVPLASIP